MTGYRYIVVFFLLSMFPCISYAQETVQVITGTYNRTFRYSTGDIIKINAEKARITITGSEKEEIIVTTKLISKARTVEIAKSELSYHQYTIEKNKDVIDIENRIVLPKHVKEFQSVLFVEIQISIPTEMELQVSNNYGNTKIENKNGKTHVNSGFGDIFLVNVGGELKLKSYYGDLKTDGLAGHSVLDLVLTPAEISGASGFINLKSSLGDIVIDNPGRLRALNIESSKSDVTMVYGREQEFRYFLQADFGELVIPQSFGVAPRDEITNRLIWTYGDPDKPEINIKANFGNIILNVE